MSPSADHPIFEASGITVRFGALTAVDDVSFVVNEHEVLGLIGPNGSGKSTLLNAVCGLVRSNGAVRIRGVPVDIGAPGSVVRHGVFRTFQTPQVDPALSCIDNVLVGSPDQAARGPVGAWLLRPRMWSHDKRRWHEASEAIERVGLSGRADEPAQALSYGDRRLLEIARACMARPALLLMDEPAAGLSAGETAHLGELLKEISGEGIGLLVIEHKLSFLEQIVQRLLVLELGRTIAQGPPDEVWKDPAVIAAYLGEPK